MKRIATIVLAGTLALSLTGCISLTPAKEAEPTAGEKTEAPDDASESAEDEDAVALELGDASMKCPSSWSVDQKTASATIATASSEDSTALAQISIVDIGSEIPEDQAKAMLKVYAETLAENAGSTVENEREDTVGDIPCLRFDFAVVSDSETADMSAISFVRGSSIYTCSVGYKDPSRKELTDGILASLSISPSTNTTDQDDASSAGSDETDEERVGALSMAFQYLACSPFSKDMLIKQLEYEGFSSEAAAWAVDLCGADWDDEAVRTAEMYLDGLDLSREELITYLEHDYFTQEQAEHAANSVGL